MAENIATTFSLCNEIIENTSTPIPTQTLCYCR